MRGTFTLKPATRLAKILADIAAYKHFKRSDETHTYGGKMLLMS
jgi:hypothetical protein